METRPSYKSFLYISASKNINFISNNNDDENKDGNTIANVVSSNSKGNADNPVILNIMHSFFQHAIKILHTEIKPKQFKQVKRFSPINLLNRIFQKFEYISLNKGQNSQYWKNHVDQMYLFYGTFRFHRNEEKKF